MEREQWSMGFLRLWGSVLRFSLLNTRVAGGIYKKKENTNGTRVEKNKNIGFRVKLQTPSGKWICKAEKEAPLPGRVFKNI